MDSENVTIPQLGFVALEALAGGEDARAALDTAIAAERHPEYRQLIVVDRAGGTAIHTGAQALGIRREARAQDVAAAGSDSEIGWKSFERGPVCVKSRYVGG